MVEVGQAVECVTDDPVLAVSVFFPCLVLLAVLDPFVHESAEELRGSLP